MTVKMAQFLDLPELTTQFLSQDKLFTENFIDQDSFLKFDLCSLNPSTKSVQVSYCKNLNEIFVSNSQQLENSQLRTVRLCQLEIESLQFLSIISNQLITLELDSLNNITEFSVLMALSLNALQNLTLSNMRHFDFSVLYQQHLKQLTIKNQVVDSFAFLINLPNLVSFTIISIQCNVSDLNTIALIQSLEKLEINSIGGQMFNFDFLRQSVSLNELILGYINIVSYNFLQSLTNLKVLQCDNTNIHEIQDIQQSIQTLQLSGCSIIDIQYVSNLINIQKLNLSRCFFIDQNFIEKLSQLTYLSISNVPISDITTLKFCLNLEYLEIDYHISLKPVQYLKKLKYLKPDIKSNERLFQALFYSPFSCIVFENQFYEKTILYHKLQAMIKLSGHLFINDQDIKFSQSEFDYFNDIIEDLQDLHDYTEQEKRVIGKEYFFVRLYEIYLYLRKRDSKIIGNQTFDNGLNQKELLFDRYKIQCDKLRDILHLTNNWLLDYDIVNEITDYNQYFVGQAKDSNQKVFIKILRKGDSFNVNEINANSILDHQNIHKLLKIYEYFSQTVYIFEYIPGMTLEQLIQEGYVFSFEELYYIIAQVAFTLAYCNSLGVVYQNLHPGNIFIDKHTQSPFQFRVVLTDFSIACFIPINSFEIPKIETQACPIKELLKPPETKFAYQISFVLDSWQLGLFVYNLIFCKYPDQVLLSQEDFELPESHDTQITEIYEIIKYLLTPNVTDRPTIFDLMKEICFGNFQKQIKLLYHVYNRDEQTPATLEDNLGQYLKTSTVQDLLTPQLPQHKYQRHDSEKLSNLSFIRSNAFVTDGQHIPDIHMVLPQYEASKSAGKLSILYADCWKVYRKMTKLRNWRHQGEFWLIEDIYNKQKLLAFDMPLQKVKSYYQKVMINVLNTTKRHPGILKLSDVFCADNHFVLLFDQTDFVTLEELLYNVKLSEDDVYLIFAQLLLVTKYCHEQDIIIRNINPKLILVKYQSHSILKYPIILFDFLSSTINNAQYEEYLANGYERLNIYSTKYSQQYSSILQIDNKVRFLANDLEVYFKSPETLKGVDEGNQVDMWQLGVLLYYICEKQYPFSKQEIELHNFDRRCILSTKYQSMQIIIDKLLISDPKIRIDMNLLISGSFTRGVTLIQSQNQRQFNLQKQKTQSLSNLSNLSKTETIQLNIEQDTDKCKLLYFIQLVKMAIQSFETLREAPFYKVVDDILYSKTDSPLDLYQIMKQNIQISTLSLDCPLIPVQKSFLLKRYIQKNTVQKSPVQFSNFTNLQEVVLINIQGNANYSFNFTKTRKVEISHCVLRLDLKNASFDFLKLDKIDLEKVFVDDSTVVGKLICDVFGCENPGNISQELRKLFLLHNNDYYVI